MFDPAKDIKVNAYLQERENSINVKVAKLNTLNKGLDEVEILEEEVEIDGKRYVLLSIEGCSEGLAIEKEHLLDGSIVIKEQYDEMLRIYLDEQVEKRDTNSDNEK